MIAFFLLFTPLPFFKNIPLSEQPDISDVTVAPAKIQSGSIMYISAIIKDHSGITKVQATNYHEQGYDVVDLHLFSGTIFNGVWVGSWVAHDTISRDYHSVITAFSNSGLCSSASVLWTDPTWWNISWIYRKQATIQNPSSNYQMKITIGYDSHASGVDVHLEGRCKTDFSDVRFVNKNNTAELSYWIENKTNGDKAIIWVKTNGENTLNIYYGNAAATTHSNGNTTFLFFDDFFGTTLGSQWTVSANSYSVSSGILRINIGAVGLSSPLSFNLNNGYIVEGRILFNTNAGGYSGTLSGQSSTYTQGSNGGSDATSLYMRESGSRTVNRWTGTGASAGYDCGSGSVFTSVENVWYILGARFDVTGVALSKDRSTVGTYGCGWTKNIRYISLGGFYGGASYDIQDTSYDWVLIRRYLSTEPSWSSFGTQEIALPTKPVLLQPTNACITSDTTPTFRWNISQNAVNHTLQVSNRSDFATLQITKSLGSTTNIYTPVTGLTDGKWYWRVRANNSQGTNVSTAWNFIIDTTGPFQPALFSPIDSYTTSQNHVTFTWNATVDNTTNTPDVSGIACYQLQVSNDNFSAVLFDQNTSDSTTFSLTATVAGRLQWRVRAWDVAGNPGSFSEIRTLTVFDFSFTASQPSVTILRGGTVSTSVIIDVNYGNNEAVTLSNEWVGIAPTGVSMNFSNVSGNGSFSSKITFVTQQDAATGEFILNVTATCLTETRSLTVTLRVAGMIYQISASPTSFTLTRSDADASTISITFQYGTKESVVLSGNWIGTAPSGVTTSISTISGLPPYDSILSFSTSNEASAGKYTYRVTANGGGITDWIYISFTIKTDLTMTLQSEKTTYEKGQEMQFSGTVDDPNGNPVRQGTVTLTLSSGSWKEYLNTTVVNGLFSTTYYVTFDKIEGTWTITGSATDTLGHVTIIEPSISVVVTTPDTYKYYTIVILSPLPGQVYKRGDVVTFTVSVMENETKIRGATVTIQPPNSSKVVLTEISPGLYSKSYQLGIDSPLGNWSTYIEGSTNENQMFKAGFGYIPLRVEPTELMLELVEPREVSFETGQKLTFTVKLLYPNGSPVDDGIVIATKSDGTVLNFRKSGNDEYTSMYTLQDEDVGYFNVQISATDIYGNIGASQGTAFTVTPMQFSSYFLQYWWLTSIILVGLTIALGYVTRDVSRIFRMKNFYREVLLLNRLKKDKASEYFLRGSISRDAYDHLIGEYESKLAKIEKQKSILEKKMRKRRP